MYSRTVLRLLTTNLCRTRLFTPFTPLPLSCNVLSSNFAHRRHLSTPPPHVNVSDLSMESYHSYSDATMDILLEFLEELLDSLGNPSYEVEYHSGVLTLILGDNGTYVINKQPPNKQIWLSSPFSGPKRYDYSPTTDAWVYSRDGRTLGDLLNTELSTALGQKVELDLESVSGKAAAE